MSCYPVGLYYTHLIVTQPQAYKTKRPKSYRKNVRLLLHVCFLAVTCWLCSSDSAANARNALDGPEVLIGPTKRDFGDVFSGEELEQNFPVRNNGTKPLELSQRSLLGNGQIRSPFRVATADWRPGNLPITRIGAARPAAPS